MIAATDQDLSAPIRRTGKDRPEADAVLFALIDELMECEKRREALLECLSTEERDNGQIEASVRKGCAIVPGLCLFADCRTEADYGGRGAPSA